MRDPDPATRADADARRLREVLDGMAEGFLLLDAGFRVVSANRRALEMDGRPEAGLLGRSHWELWPASLGTPVEEAYRRCMRDRRPFRLEHRYVAPGHDVWLDIRGWPSGDGIALLYADTTAARRAREERERAAELDRRRLGELEALYRNGPIGFALLDPGLRYLRCNEALAEINGVPAGAHLGRTVREVVPGVADAVEAVFRSVFETGQAVTGLEVEGETPREPGRRRCWLENVAPVADPGGRPWAALVTVQDITDRRAAERALAASERRFRVSQDLSPDGFTILRAVRGEGGAVVDFEWEYANPAARRMLGAEGERLEGTRLLARLPGNGGGPDSLFARYVRVVETGEPHDVELRHDADGIAGWFRNTAVRLDDGVAVSFSDITARKAGEEARALLAREADHRAKNLLQVVEALVMMTEAGDAGAYREAVLGRLRAMRRAQPLTGAGRGGIVSLPRLVADELAPFEGRVTATGPDLALAEDVALPVALALHELATNAAKHGALSSPGGRVLVSWSLAGGGLVLEWREEGGPPVAGPPARQGFGTRLLARGVSGQAGGRLALDWHPAGLRCTLTLPASALPGHGAAHP